MKTPTHALIGWSLGWLLDTSERDRRAAAVGAVLPDLPVWGLYLGCMLEHAATGREMRDLMDRTYFDDPVFIAFHHLGHAPMPLLAMTLAALLLTRKLGAAAGPLLFGLIGATSHMIVDLFTHGEDGAMVLWPLDRERRLNMNLDQWDLGGAGLMILTAELVTWLIFLLVCVRTRVRRFSPIFKHIVEPIDPAQRVDHGEARGEKRAFGE